MYTAHAHHTVQVYRWYTYTCTRPQSPLHTQVGLLLIYEDLDTYYNLTYQAAVSAVAGKQSAPLTPLSTPASVPHSIPHLLPSAPLVSPRYLLVCGR